MTACPALLQRDHMIWVKVPVRIPLTGIHAEGFPNSNMLLANQGYIPNLPTSPTTDTENTKDIRLVYQ